MFHMTVEEQSPSSIRITRYWSCSTGEAVETTNVSERDNIPPNPVATLDGLIKNDAEKEPETEESNVSRGDSFLESRSSSSGETVDYASNEEELDQLQDSVVGGGRGSDGTNPIDPNSVGWYQNRGIVMIRGNDVRAYPRSEEQVELEVLDSIDVVDGPTFNDDNAVELHYYVNVFGNFHVDKELYEANKENYDPASF